MDIECYFFEMNRREFYIDTKRLFRYYQRRYKVLPHYTKSVRVPYNYDSNSLVPTMSEYTGVENLLLMRSDLDKFITTNTSTSNTETIKTSEISLEHTRRPLHCRIPIVSRRDYRDLLRIRKLAFRNLRSRARLLAKVVGDTVFQGKIMPVHATGRNGNAHINYDITDNNLTAGLDLLFPEDEQIALGFVSSKENLVDRNRKLQSFLEDFHKKYHIEVRCGAQCGPSYTDPFISAPESTRLLAYRMAAVAAAGNLYDSGKNFF